MPHSAHVCPLNARTKDLRMEDSISTQALGGDKCPRAESLAQCNAVQFRPWPHFASFTVASSALVSSAFRQILNRRLIAYRLRIQGHQVEKLRRDVTPN